MLAEAELLAQRQHKMEVALVSWRIAQLAAVVALVRPILVEMAGQVVAVALVALLLVLAEQEIHQAHHQAKVVTVGLQLLTTPHHLMALVAAAVLAGQQHQMGQVHQAQRLAMAQMEQRLLFLVHR